MRAAQRIAATKRAAILQRIRDHGPINSQDIARYSGIPPRTVANLATKLHKDGEIRAAWTTIQGAHYWIIVTLADLNSKKKTSASVCDSDEDLFLRKKPVADPEHEEWMAFWRKRWEDRKARKAIHLHERRADAHQRRA